MEDAEGLEEVRDEDASWRIGEEGSCMRQRKSQGKKKRKAKRGWKRRFNGKG